MKTPPRKALVYFSVDGEERERQGEKKHERERDGERIERCDAQQEQWGDSSCLRVNVLH